MSAPLRNQFWKARRRHGVKSKFETSEQLWDACCEYFEWVEANPLQKMMVYHYQGKITRACIDKLRAMTIAGLCNFLNISDRTWSQYRKRPDLSEVTERVDMIIFVQKFEGAAVGFFNANIIARDIGLANKTAHLVITRNPEKTLFPSK